MTADSIFSTALIVGLVAALVSIVCLAYFAFESAASRNIALSTGTLAAAIVMFTLQIVFELQGTETTEFFSPEYSFDRATPSIGLDSLRPSNLNRWAIEKRASDAFASANAGQFDGDREEVLIQFTLASILGYIGTEHFDWQLRRVQFKTPSMSMTTLGFQSPPRDCATVTAETMSSLLAKVGNPFAKVRIFPHGRVCLPPNSTIVIHANAMIIANPFCEIEFKIEPSRSVMHGLRGRGFDVVKLPNGESRFETTPMGVRASVRYSAVRAQHRRMEKYRDWAEGVVAGVGAWLTEVEETAH